MRSRNKASGSSPRSTSARLSRTSSTSTSTTRSSSACNPQLAHRALEIDPRIATLLPCNVVVRTEDGRTVVEALDPKIIAEVPDNPALAPIAEEAGQRIQAALDALGSA